LMDEIEEIRRNLRLLNQPTHREVFHNDEENTDRRTEVTIEKCIITTIDPYGYTQQQVVLKTPIHMIDIEDVPSTSSGRGVYDRMERGENRRNDDEDDDDDDILSEETLEWLEMASETTFDMAAQNQDYMDQLRALRSW
uniref:Kinesin motor domain-containing protein n=1 Tax=Heligmosomoides polygyrus TaxID=6339 RepID=A0A183F8Z2_HELPZ